MIKLFLNLGWHKSLSWSWPCHGHFDVRWGFPWCGVQSKESRSSLGWSWWVSGCCYRFTSRRMGSKHTNRTSCCYSITSGLKAFHFGKSINKIIFSLLTCQSVLCPGSQKTGRRRCPERWNRGRRRGGEIKRRIRPDKNWKIIWRFN